MKIERSFSQDQIWLMINKDDLETERMQLLDEGKDISSVEEEFKSLISVDPKTPEAQIKFEALLDKALNLPNVDGYKYVEPSTLAEIEQEASYDAMIQELSLSDDELYDKVLGAWQGRASGCLLGKPVEGRYKGHIEKYLSSQGKYPLSYYFSNEATQEIKDETGIHGWDGCMAENITCMVEDDDTNYTVTGLLIIKKYGKEFTPQNVGNFWMDNLPISHVCTAERIAYKNIVNCYFPPASAWFRNPYREWIGAQIRADFFGYVNPGNIKKAAEYAFRDASISHVKNGIYGEMWSAGMIAASFTTDNMINIIKAGLSVVPKNSRLTEGVRHILDLYNKSLGYDEVVADVHSRWNEKKGHHWCHTISNAEIVTIGLLWGENDFEKTITYAVMPGFDTDCNGATVGSIIGAVLGAKNMPKKWISPLNDTMITGLHGYNKVSLSDMAKMTMELIKK